MKTIGLTLLIIMGLLSPLHAVDYNNDGVNDDPYMPGLKSYASTGLSFYINMKETDPLFSLTISHDSNTNYAFSTADGFVLRNDGDTIMEALEMGSATISIDISQLPEEFKTDLSAGALKIDVLESSNFRVSSQPVTINNNAAKSISFMVTGVDEHSTQEPLRLNLYNTSTGQNMILSSAKKGMYMTVDDAPFGHITGINSAQSHEGLSVISADAVIIDGWAFDDDDMTVRLYNTITGMEIDSTVQRSVGAINTEIPFWGSDYQSQFTLSWHDPAAYGYYEVSVHLNDGSHDIVLPGGAIFLNRAPQGEITAPLADSYVDYTEFVIAGAVYDIDVNVGLGSYISCAELYIDGTLLTSIPNPEPENDTFYFSFTYPADTSVLPDGRHTLYAVAHDSFGSTTIFGERTFLSVSSVPVITSISPRIGPWHGNTMITVNGEGLALATNLRIGQAQHDLSGAALSDDACITLLPAIDVPQSRYVDVAISNPLGSFISYDGYHFIQAELDTSVTSATVADIIYDNSKKMVIVADEYASSIIRYDVEDCMLYYHDELEITSGTNAYLADISRAEDALCVVTQPYYVLELIDLSDNSRNMPTVTLPGVNDLTRPTSLAWMQCNNILIGSTGDFAQLFKIEMDNAYSGYSVSTIQFDTDYEKITVVGSSNKAVAYILCADFDTDSIDLFVYESQWEHIRQVDLDYQFSGSDASLLRLSTDYNGSEFLLYSAHSTYRFNADGDLLESAAYGADLILYDERRPVFYSINDNDSFFTLHTSRDLNKELTYCHFPESATARAVASLDWKGDYMFAVADEGISIVKLSDIYPHVECTPLFAEQGGTLTLTSHNSGNVAQNVSVVVSDTYIPATHVSSDNDDHVFSIQVPMDNDSSGQLHTLVSDIPSEGVDVLMMCKLFDKITDTSGLDSFYPAGLFYDEVRSDLYAFDPSHSGPVSIVRVHLDIDNDGAVTAVRKSIPPEMQVANPISITRVHDYILVVSLYLRSCSWFNVVDWDTEQAARVQAAVISPYICPSGARGYSPSDRPDINYAYVWNSISTGWADIFQLDLDTGEFQRCPLISPYTNDIFIEHNAVDSSLDRAYAVSRQLWGCASNYITVFDPRLPASDMAPVTKVQMNTISSLYKVFSTQNALFASFINTTGLGLFVADESGAHNHAFVPIYDNDSLTATFFDAGAENLAFSARTTDNTYSLNIMDSNMFNDSPAADPYDVVYSYDAGTRKAEDVKIIGNKLVTIIGKEIYIVDLNISGRKNK